MEKDGIVLHSKNDMENEDHISIEITKAMTMMTSSSAYHMIAFLTFIQHIMNVYILLARTYHFDVRTLWNDLCIIYHYSNHPTIQLMVVNVGTMFIALILYILLLSYNKNENKVQGVIMLKDMIWWMIHVISLSLILGPGCVCSLMLSTQNQMKWSSKDEDIIRGNGEDVEDVKIL